MDTFGTFTIIASVIGIYGPSRACMYRPKVVSTIYCTRTEAQTLAQHHAKEVQRESGGPRYEYSFRTDAERIDVN